MRPLALLLTVFSCVSVSSGLAQAEELTLPAAIALARRQAPDYLAAHERVRAAEGQYIQAGLWFPSNPELSAGWVDDRFFKNEGERRLGVELSQEIEIAGQPGLRGDVAELQLHAARAGRTAFERVYVARVMQAFFGLVYSQSQIEIQNQILQLNEELFAASARRLAAGDIPEVEHNLIVAEVERARADVSAAIAEEIGARAELNRLVGRAATAPAHAVGGLPTRPREQDDSSSSDRLDLRAAKLEVEARATEVSLLGREVVPSPRLSLGWELERSVFDADLLTRDPSLAQRLDGFTDENHFFVLRLSLPIPVFNRNQGSIQEASARRSEAQLRAEALEQTVEAQIATARAQLSSASKRLSIYAQLLPTAERNLKLLSTAFSAGQINAATLLAARDRSFRARLDYLDAQRTYATSRVTLARATGTDPETLLEEVP